MLKFMLYFISAIILAMLIGQCTKAYLKRPGKSDKKYGMYPYLKDGVESKNYKLRYISSPYEAFITYDSINKYFFVAQPPYRKIDLVGIEKMKIDYDKNLDNPLFTHYLFDKEGVYDISGDKLEKQSFDKIINADFSLKREGWDELFSSYYNKAQVVVYGNQMDYKYTPIYLKIDKSWILFLSSSHDGFNFDLFLGINSENYPAKFNRMVLLKDPKKKAYSNGLTEREVSELNLNDKTFSLSYPTNFKIKTLHYHKEMVTEDFPYTPIPQECSGTAYYRLQIENDSLYFKEKALRNCFGFTIKTYLYWYVLPNKFINDSPLSFLELRYPHNINESGSNGLYIIHKK